MNTLKSHCKGAAVNAHLILRDKEGRETLDSFRCETVGWRFNCGACYATIEVNPEHFMEAYVANTLS